MRGEKTVHSIAALLTRYYEELFDLAVSCTIDDSYRLFVCDWHPGCICM